jgi:hypothetical protein
VKKIQIESRVVKTNTNADFSVSFFREPSSLESLYVENKRERETKLVRMKMIAHHFWFISAIVQLFFLFFTLLDGNESEICFVPRDESYFMFPHVL